MAAKNSREMTPSGGRQNPTEVLRYYGKIIDPVIKELLSDGVARKTKSLLLHQVSVGGKRLRPTLAILSCLACGGKLKDALYPAAALEILHTHTLIIDDIIDKSPKRRGQPTTWEKFGRSFAECIASDYGASLLAATAQSPTPERIGPLLSKALKAVMDGEMQDILLEQGRHSEDRFIDRNRLEHTSLSFYKKMIGNKTASLLEASCRVGAVCAWASKKQVEALGKYGWNIGLAFQITDDILDIYGWHTGKPTGQDIREGKLGNALVLFALQDLSRKERQELMQALRSSHLRLSKKTLQHATELIKGTNARGKASRLAHAYTEKGVLELRHVPQSPHRKQLEDLAVFLCYREQ